jgi:hypothetical protein
VPEAVQILAAPLTMLNRGQILNRETLVQCCCGDVGQVPVQHHLKLVVLLGSIDEGYQRPFDTTRPVVQLF